MSFYIGSPDDSTWSLDETPITGSDCIVRTPVSPNKVSLTVLGLLLFSGAMAEEKLDPRYDLPIVTNELRSYFAELSDSEYVSVDPAPTLYPVLTPVWGRMPFTSDSVMGYDSPHYATDATIAFQQPLLAPGGDPLLRTQTVLELAQTRNPTAMNLIWELLARETDQQVIADALKAALLLDVTDAAGKVAPYLDSPTSQIRFLAYELYARQDKADIGRLLVRAGQEQDIAMRCRALDQAATHAERTRLDGWLPFWQDADVLVRVSALRGILQLTGVLQHRDNLLSQSREGRLAVKRAIAEGLHRRLDPDLCVDVVRALAADDNTSIRAAAAEAIGRLALPALEEVLISLGRDKHSDVRLSAARQLRAFADQASFDALLVLGGDAESLLVREAARESVLAMADRFPVKVRISAAIDSDNEYIRDLGYRVAATLKTDLHKVAIARQLAGEKTPANIEHAILALAYGDGRAASDLILTFQDHPSAGVRRAVIVAVGELPIDTPATRELLMKKALVEGDSSQDVRSAVFIAMGRLLTPDFAPVLLTVLNRTALTSPVASSEDDRVGACWVASRLGNPTPQLLSRLRAIMTTPVIKTEMGPAFDGDLVRTATCWAAVDLAIQTKEPAVVKLANDQIEVMKMNDPDYSDMSAAPSGMPIPTSDMLRAYGAEAQSFLAGKPIHRVPVPLGTFKFRFFAYEKR